METTIRHVTAEEFPAYARTIDAAFGETSTDEEIEGYRQSFDPSRCFAGFDGDQIVATIWGVAFDLTLPGLATIPVGGITGVGVLPTHRRRGLLRGLMQRELDTFQERGEPIAILNASESSIYGRFGFGAATFVARLEIDRRHADLTRSVAPGGRFALIDADRAAVVLPEMYDRARRQQPGEITRDAARWKEMFRHYCRAHEGASPMYFVTYQSATGQIDGVACYRIKGRWDNGLPNGVVQLREMITTTPEAATTLWQYCLHIDLTTTVQAHDRPLDEPFRWQLADPRQLRVTRLTDHLWVRILDVPAALSARRYAVADRIVLEIADSFRPGNTGRYALEGSPDSAMCRRTDEAPDLTLEIADLGAAYLGGVRFGTLARAGRVVEQRDGAARRADLLFTSDPPPWCGTSF